MNTYMIDDNGTTRLMNTKEQELFETQMADAKTQLKAAADKASARQAILDRLGITADEAALLLG